MKRLVNLPVPGRPETPQSPALARVASRTARPDAAPVLELTQDRRFAKAAKAYAEAAALAHGGARSVDIYL